MSTGKVRVRCTSCGCELERWPSEVRRTQHSFCPGGTCQGTWRSREVGSPAKSPEAREKISAARLRLTADVRERLEASAGACRCPSCKDPECPVPHGSCHFPGCDQPAAISSKTASRRGHVRGWSRKYCEEHAFAGGGLKGGEVRSLRAKELADRLLAEAGGCGSPTCSDTACEVAHGRCHLTGCNEPAAIAPQTLEAARWVRGMPTLCCSGAHGAQYARAEESRRLGLLNGREAAARLLQQSPSRVTTLAVEGRLPTADVRSWRRLYNAEDINAFERGYALSLDEDGRRRAAIDPDIVVTRLKGRGHLAARAARHGLTESQTEALVRAEVLERSRQLRNRRRGRRPSAGPPPHHLEWTSMFGGALNELERYYSERAELENGDRPPTKWEAFLVVAERDVAKNPERWPVEYRQRDVDGEWALRPDMARAAANLVGTAIKPLLVAHNGNNAS